MKNKNNLLKMWKDKYYENKEETKRLHSIIKEVRIYRTRTKIMVKKK